MPNIALATIGLGGSCGTLEVLLIIAVILMIFGPKSLPELVRKFSRTMSMMRRAADDFKNQIMEMDRPPYKEPEDFYASSPYPGHGVDIDGVPAINQPTSEGESLLPPESSGSNESAPEVETSSSDPTYDSPESVTAETKPPTPSC